MKVLWWQFILFNDEHCNFLYFCSTVQICLSKFTKAELNMKVWLDLQVLAKVFKYWLKKMVCM